MLLLRHYVYHILIGNYMTQPTSLRNMPRTSSPDQSILEIVLQVPMYLTTDIFDRGVAPNYHRLTEVWGNSSPSQFVSVPEGLWRVPAAYRFVYRRMSRSSSQHRSTTSWIPRSSSQLMTTVFGSRASLSRKSILTLSILL